MTFSAAATVIQPEIPTEVALSDVKNARLVAMEDARETGAYIIDGVQPSSHAEIPLKQVIPNLTTREIDDFVCDLEDGVSDAKRRGVENGSVVIGGETAIKIRKIAEAMFGLQVSKDSLEEAMTVVNSDAAVSICNEVKSGRLCGRTRISHTR